MVASKVQPRTSPAIKPSTKEPRYKSDPENNMVKKPAWRVGQIDICAECSWSFMHPGNSDWWNEIHPKLANYETMTWQEILNATGGRSHGNNNHNVPISDIIPEARKRLEELGLDDLDQLFSLRLTNHLRIWGILEGHILKLLWLDPKHEICPSLK